MTESPPQPSSTSTLSYILKLASQAMNVSILLLVYLVLPKYIAATVHTVIAGDINDVISTLGLVADYDTVLIPPGDYVFDLNYDANIGGTPNGDLCAAMPGVNYTAPAPNLLIRGTGSSRSDVKLVGALFEYCNRNIVIENLSLYTVPTGPTNHVRSPVEEDGDNGTMLRNTYVQVPVITNRNPFKALYIMSQRIAVMYSTIETNPPVPSMGVNVGIDDDCSGLSVIKSTFAGFTKGIQLSLRCYEDYQGDVDEVKVNRNIKIYGSDLSQNTIPIDGDPTALATVTSLFSPNTPQGQNYSLKTIIDILRFHTYYDAPYVPIRIRVKKANKAGETTIYRVPSAYPEPPLGFISALEPQYYQFDSTAKFGKKSNVSFKKSDIQSKFPGFSGTLTFMYHDGTTWNTVNHVNSGVWYKMTFPEKSMEGLIAIFKNI